MSEAIAQTEIVDACRLLFSPAVVIDADFLAAIAEDDLKTAFRKKALKTHPDRAKALGRSREELSRMFQDVSAAYETLKALISADKARNIREKGNKPPQPEQAGPKRQKTAVKDHYYRGAMPKRELRLAEYLYYSGKISWRTLISAITWQKSQRPLFGQIARQWKYLSEADIRYILKSKTGGEKFGDCALRQGLLSCFQQMAVTGRQKQLQPPIGRHFIDQGLFSAAQLERLVERNVLYNRRIRYPN